jgi:uncharacterized coiled-coil protein SlyX
MSDKQERAYWVTCDEKDFRYTLHGPDGFDSTLGEPEDCSWVRDGKDAVDRLNDQHDTIATLRRELAEARKATELCANGQRTLIEKVEQANARASAVTIDNARKDEALEGLVDGLDANCDGRDGLSNEQWDRRVALARAALSSTPDALVKEVRRYMRHDIECEECVTEPCTCGLDALLAKLGGKP